MPELLHYHCFLPTGIDATDPVFSVWESREPMSADDFRGFIEGPMSPIPGATSEVYQVASIGTPPLSAFPRRPGVFAGRMLMPLMDDTMNMWNTMLPFKLTLEDEGEVDGDDENNELFKEEVEEAIVPLQNAAPQQDEEEDPAMEADKDEALVWKIEAAMPFEVPAPQSAATRAVRQKGHSEGSDAGGDFGA